MKKMLINGEWCDAQDGGTIPVIVPSTGQRFDDVARGAKPEVDAAVRRAFAAVLAEGIPPVHSPPS